MKIIVGLGNPDPKHSLTRHNLGFVLIDAIVRGNNFEKKHKSLIRKIKIEETTVLLVKPQTFMNLSGQAIKEIVHFYKKPLEDLLVVHDDKDQLFGRMKFQKDRGHGGHNGVKNIHQELGSSDYCRLKIGIAPPGPIQQSTSQFVLSPFQPDEEKQLPTVLQRGVEAVCSFVTHGLSFSASQFNSKKL